MIVKNPVYRAVSMKWNSIDLPLRAGTPASLGGVVANNASAIGLIPQTVDVKPELPELFILIAGDVEIASAEAESGNKLSTSAIKAMSGLHFYLPDGSPYSPEAETQQMIDNRIYAGVDLADKHSAEIAARGGNIWAWIAARIKAGNFEGINIGDYITFEATKTFHARVAGINTYKGYGDSGHVVGNHIDFICSECWSTAQKVNKVDFNNGTYAQEHPWLASDMYLWLNSKSDRRIKGTGAAITAANYESKTEAVDYTTGGVLYNLPDALKAVIVEKRMFLAKRYSSSGVLTDDNAGAWQDIGKLWLPTEIEIYGCTVGNQNINAAAGSMAQYPLFAGNNNRRIGVYNAVLLNPAGGSSADWCRMGGTGVAGTKNCSNAAQYAPICFRIA